MNALARPVTVSTLHKLKAQGEKFAVLTAYDASFAAVLEAAGVEVLLVGDSLGMVVQGQATTLPVTLDEMVYHTRCVARGAGHAMVMADLPFMSYATVEQALASAARLMKEGGAQMLKLEATDNAVEVVRRLAANGIPVCGHLGLAPQTVHKLGGYRVQGREPAAAQAMLAEARAMEAAGADLLLLESVPSTLAETITRSVQVPVIGIGAGPVCDAQVLVLYDLLGISTGKRPRFSKDFLADLDGAGPISIRAAVAAYVQAVKAGTFPAAEHSFT